MRDLDYIYAVARIRVKEKSLLSDDDIRRMAGMEDCREILNALSDRGWGDGSLEDDDGNRMLEVEEKKTADLMKELKADPEIFRVLSFPRLYHNLKAGIRELCTAEPPDHLYYDIEGFGKEDVCRILREKDYTALPEHMRKTAQRAQEAMLRTQDGQKCDLIIDRGCLDACEKAGRESGIPLLEEYEESCVAVTDIKIAVRAQKTGKDLKFLKEALAPCRTEEEIQKMVNDAKAHENEDKAAKEKIEVKNKADSMVYQTEKQLKDLGDKLSPEAKSSVQESIDKLKADIKNDNTEAMKATMKELEERLMKFGEEIYKSQAANQAGAQGAPNAGAADAGAKKNDDGVVDAEIVDDDK